MKIFVIGYMAAGKTRFAKKLAAQLGLSFIDLDEVVLNEAKISSAEYIRKFGESMFRKFEHNCLMKCLNGDNFVLATGGGTPCFFDNMNLMNKNGITVWLNIPFAHILQRLTNKRGDRPMVATVNGKIDKIKVEEHYQKRIPFYMQSQIIIDEADVSCVIEKLNM